MPKQPAAYRECICCGVLIETPFWLCQSCEDAYGVSGIPWRNWPQYLKDMYAMARREERRTRRLGFMSIDDLSGASTDIRGCYTPDPTSLTIRASSCPERDADVDDGYLRPSPYGSDEAANREYRRANGVR